MYLFYILENKYLFIKYANINDCIKNIWKASLLCFIDKQFLEENNFYYL